MYCPFQRIFTSCNIWSEEHLSVNCIYDSLLLGETFEICFKNIRATLALLRELGFTIHPEKGVVAPTQQIIFLGFVIDSVKMTITLTGERKQSIYTLCQNILSNYQATIRELAQTIVVIVPSFRAVPYGQIYYRESEKCKVQSLARSDGNFDKKAYISEEAANELKWWIRNILHPLNSQILILQFFLMQVWKVGEAQVEWRKLR